MKYLDKKFATFILSAGFMMFVFSSCGNKPNDQEIQNNISQKLKDSSLNNINAAVADGVVTLTGKCEGADCNANAERIIKDMEGVKSINNSIEKMEVETDLTLRSSVQTIISRYQGVQADVAAGNVVLRGSISRDLIQPLMTELQALKPKQIDNQLAVQ